MSAAVARWRVPWPVRPRSSLPSLWLAMRVELGGKKLQLERADEEAGELVETCREGQ